MDILIYSIVVIVLQQVFINFSIVIKLHILDIAIDSITIILSKGYRKYHQVPNVHKFLRTWYLPLCIHCLTAFRSLKFYQNFSFQIIIANSYYELLYARQRTVLYIHFFFFRNAPQFRTQFPNLTSHVYKHTCVYIYMYIYIYTHIYITYFT